MIWLYIAINRIWRFLVTSVIIIIIIIIINIIIIICG